MCALIRYTDSVCALIRYTDSLCRGSGEFETAVDLPPGTHEYKYLVDGAWTHDSSQVSTSLYVHLELCALL